MCVTLLTQHTLAQTNESTSGLLQPPPPLSVQQGGHWFAILGNVPSIQILWSMPPIANMGVPTLLAVQLLPERGSIALKNNPPLQNVK